MTDTLGARVKAWRIKTKTTRTEAAASVAISEHYLGRIERGEVEPRGPVTLLLEQMIARPK
jgi:DNA-binding XRE family transcriptional regulator